MASPPGRADAEVACVTAASGTGLGDGIARASALVLAAGLTGPTE